MQPGGRKKTGFVVLCRKLVA